MDNYIARIIARRLQQKFPNGCGKEDMKNHIGIIHRFANEEHMGVIQEMIDAGVAFPVKITKGERKQYRSFAPKMKIYSEEKVTEDFYKKCAGLTNRELADELVERMSLKQMKVFVEQEEEQYVFKNGC